MAVKPAHSRRILTRLSRLNEKTPFLVLAMWAWLYLPRPFQLGFYHDDWWSFVEVTRGSAPFSLQRLSLFLGVRSTYAPRPLGGFLAFLFNSLAGTSAFLYHSLAALLVLLAALSLRGWFRKLLDQSDAPVRMWAADLSVAFWLSVPWSFAATGWVTSALFQVPAQIFFTEAFRQLPPPGQIDSKRLILFGAGLTASYLTYEAFYFQFLLVTVFYLMFQWHIFKSRVQMLWFAGIGLGTQILALATNRYLASVSPEFSKKFDSAWWALFRQSLLGLPHQLVLRMGENAGIWTGLGLAFGALAFIALLSGLRSRPHLAATGYALAVLLAGAGAMLLAIFTYSVAQYAVIASGLQSRTLFPVCWDLTIIFLGMLLLLLQWKWRAAAFLSLAIPVGMILLDAMAQRHQIQEMAYVWNQEREILSRAPVDAIKALPKDSRVLFIGPSYFDDLVIFGAYWDITGAVFSLPPLNQGRQAYQGLTMMDSATTLYNWSWDGKTLIQDLPGYWKETRPAAHLFVWNFDQNQFFEAEKGFHWPPAL